jgi:hypothetical protein
VIDTQTAVPATGTSLPNRQSLEFYYRENYTVVEMEAGPYLDALYESTYPTRHPAGEHINFTRLPFDLGILHYASDTPYTRGKNLGAASLAYLGMDSAYATVVAMARRIFTMELAQIAREQERTHQHRDVSDAAMRAGDPSLPPAANGNGGNGALEPAAGAETETGGRRHRRADQ